MTRIKGYSKSNVNGTTVLTAPKSEGWFIIDTIDLSGVAAAELTINYTQPVKYGYDFEIRVDSPDGKEIGRASLPVLPAKGPLNTTTVKLNLDATTDRRFHDLYIVSRPKDPKEITDIGVQSLRLIPK